MERFNTPVGEGRVRGGGQKGEDGGFGFFTRRHARREGVKNKKVDSERNKKKKTLPACECVKVDLIDAAAGFTLITLPCN